MGKGVMQTPVLILPVKGQILRTWGQGGEKWQNFADVLYGWPPSMAFIVRVSKGILHIIVRLYLIRARLYRIQGLAKSDKHTMVESD